MLSQTLKKKNPTGIVLWQGKSLIDNERIMLVATGVMGGGLQKIEKLEI